MNSMALFSIYGWRSMGLPAAALFPDKRGGHERTGDMVCYLVLSAWSLLLPLPCATHSLLRALPPNFTVPANFLLALLCC